MRKNAMVIICLVAGLLGGTGLGVGIGFMVSPSPEIVEDYSDEYNDLLIDYAILQAEIVGLHGDILDLNTEIDSLGNTITDLNTEIVSLGNNISDLEDEIVILEGVINDLMEGNETLVAYYLGIIASLNADILGLENDIEILNAQILSLQNDLVIMTALKDGLQTDLDNLWDAYNFLENDYFSLLNSNSQLQTDYDALETLYITTLADLNALQVDYGILQADYNTLQTAYDDLMGYVAILEGDLNNLWSMYLILEDDYNRLYDPLYVYYIPTIDEVMYWLFNVDDTDTSPYVDDLWMCGDFAAMLMTRAKTMNWRMRIACMFWSEFGDLGWMNPFDPYGEYGHAFNVILCQDYNGDSIDDWFYIEPQTDAVWYVTIGTNEFVHYDIWLTFDGGMTGTVWDVPYYINHYSYFA